MRRVTWARGWLPVARQSYDMILEPSSRLDGKPGDEAFTCVSAVIGARLVGIDPRYARDIGRYALHAASSARLLQGFGLDGDHQDHKDWKDRWDPQCLLFYEALTAWDWNSGHRRLCV